MYLRDACALRRFAAVLVDQCRCLVSAAAFATRRARRVATAVAASCNEVRDSTTTTASTHCAVLLDDVVRRFVQQQVTWSPHPLLQPHRLLRLLDEAVRSRGDNNDDDEASARAHTTPRPSTTTTTVGALYDELVMRNYGSRHHSNHDSDDGVTATTPSLTTLVQHLLQLAPLVVSLSPSPHFAVTVLARHGVAASSLSSCCCCCCCCSSCCCSCCMVRGDACVTCAAQPSSSSQAHTAACLRALRRLHVTWQPWLTQSLRAELMSEATAMTQQPYTRHDVHALASLLLTPAPTCSPSSSSSSSSRTLSREDEAAAALRVVSLLRYVPHYYVPLTLIRQHVACDVHGNSDDKNAADRDGVSLWQTLMMAVADAAALVEWSTWSVGCVLRLRRDVLQALTAHDDEKEERCCCSGNSDTTMCRHTVWRMCAQLRRDADGRYALLPHNKALLHHALCVLVAAVPTYYVAVTRIARVYAVVLQAYVDTLGDKAAANAAAPHTHALVAELHRRFAHVECLLDHTDVSFALQWRPSCTAHDTTKTAAVSPPLSAATTAADVHGNDNNDDDHDGGEDDAVTRVCCVHTHVRLHEGFAHAQRGVADALYTPTRSRDEHTATTRTRSGAATNTTAVTLCASDDTSDARCATATTTATAATTTPGDALPDEELSQLLAEMTRGVVLQTSPQQAATTSQTTSSDNANEATRHDGATTMVADVVHGTDGTDGVTHAAHTQHAAAAAPLRDDGRLRGIPRAPCKTTGAAAAAPPPPQRVHERQWQQWHAMITSNTPPVTMTTTLPPQPSLPLATSCSSAARDSRQTMSSSAAEAADDDATLRALLQSDAVRDALRALLGKATR